MDVTEYLDFFDSSDLRILNILGDMADFFISSLKGYRLWLDERNNENNIIIFNEFKLTRKTNSYDVNYEYIGQNPILQNYFTDLNNNLGLFPIPLLMLDKDRKESLNSLLNGGTVSILCDYIENRLDFAEREILEDSRFLSDESELMDTSRFDSMFSNPIRDFIKLLITPSKSTPIALNRLIGRQEEIFTSYNLLADTLRYNIFDKDILDLLGHTPERQDVWHYNQYLKINTIEKIKKLLQWKKEHTYKPLILCSGYFLKRLNIHDRNTFSRKNLVLPMIDRFDKDITSDSPIFFDSRCYKYFWCMNEQLLMALLLRLGVYQNVGGNKTETMRSVALFMNTIFWFARTKHAVLKPHIVEELLRGRFVERFLQNESNNMNIYSFLYAMDALYEYALSGEFSNKLDFRVFLQNIQDYMVAYDLETPNYISFTKKISGKSLLIKSDIWHKQVRIKYYKNFKFNLEKDEHILNTTQFELITNVDELIKEGNEMAHCALTYAPDILNDEYLIYKVTDRFSKERVTLGVRKNDWAMELDQVRGLSNTKPSDRILNTCFDFIKHIKQKYK